MKDRVVSLSSNGDPKRNKSKFKSSQVVPYSEPPKHTCITHALPPDRNHTVTVLAEDKPIPSAPPLQCWTTDSLKQYAGSYPALLPS